MASRLQAVRIQLMARRDRVVPIADSSHCACFCSSSHCAHAEGNGTRIDPARTAITNVAWLAIFDAFLMRNAGNGAADVADAERAAAMEPIRLTPAAWQPQPHSQGVTHVLARQPLGLGGVAIADGGDDLQMLAMRQCGAAR